MKLKKKKRHGTQIQWTCKHLKYMPTRRAHTTAASVEPAPLQFN